LVVFFRFSTDGLHATSNWPGPAAAGFSGSSGFCGLLDFLRRLSNTTIKEEPMEDWYERRDELEPGQVFKTCWGDVVKLDYRVPGDGTKWRVADLDARGWAYYESTIEPGDLEDRLPDDYSGEPAAPGIG
jgi:hypothetical protein